MEIKVNLMSNFACFQGDSRNLIPRGCDPSVPKFFATLPMPKLLALERQTKKFGMITHVGSSVFLYMTSTTPRLRKMGLQCPPPQKWTSYMRAHSMINSNQILHGDKTRCEEKFYAVDNEC